MKTVVIVSAIIFILLVGVLFILGYQNSLMKSLPTNITEAQLRDLSLTDNIDIVVNKANNEIEFHGLKITIPIIASPSNGNMYSFGVYGLVNPTIIVPKDSEITLKFVNADDDMYHGVFITNGSPPYPFMGVSMFNRPAFVNSYVEPLAPEESGNYKSLSNTFKADKNGIFYYVCQIMGHAANGMYGKFVIKTLSKED